MAREAASESFEDLLRKIGVACDECDRVIAFVAKSVEDPKFTVKKSVHLISATPSVDTVKYMLGEEVIHTPVRTFVETWNTPESKFVAVRDIFKAGLFWDENTTFAKLVDVVAGVRESLECFGDIGETPYTMASLQGLCHNILIIRGHLNTLKDQLTGGVEGMTLAAKRERIQALQAATTSLIARRGLRVTNAATTRLSTLGCSLEHQDVLREWIKQAKLEDGATSSDFRRKCCSKRCVLLVIRSDTDHIFGAYTTNGFADRSYTYDPSAFLFTLTNPHGIPPTRYKCVDPDHATYFRGDFVVLGTGYDLHIMEPFDATSASELHPKVPCFHAHAMHWMFTCYADNGFHFPVSFADTTGQGSLTFTGHAKGWRIADMCVLQA